MIYVIMCGGFYGDFETPKQLSVIKGETLVDRTIRLLKKNGVSEIYISSNDKRFDGHGVERLEHKNTFKLINKKEQGYWLDAFYPHFPKDSEITYLFGDVYFSENAIRTIINASVAVNTLVGNSVAKNKAHLNIGEPFAYIVKDYRTFLDGIEAVKKLQDDGMVARHPIVWELYRYLNGLDVNRQQIVDETYICIDDETIDVDAPSQVVLMNDQ